MLRWEYSLRGTGFSLSLGVAVLKPEPVEAPDVQELEPAAEGRANERAARAIGPGESTEEPKR